MKNRLLGRFPTFRKDDGDVEYHLPPPSPPTRSSWLWNSRRPCFCFSLTQDNDKKQPKIPIKPPCTDESENASKNSIGRLCQKLRKQMYARFKFFGRQLFASLHLPGETVVGGREGGGRNTARSEFHLGLSKYVWGKLGLSLNLYKFDFKHY